MKHRPLAFVLITAAAINIYQVPTRGQVLGTSTVENAAQATAWAPGVKTTTAFDQTEVDEYEEISFETEYKDDPDVEYGVETVTQEGSPGTKTLTYLVTHWEDAIIDKLLINTETEEPTTEIVSRGTKIVWRELETPDAGRIKYWAKMTVWATKYDHTCLGCNRTTAVGAELKKGVCAVDPKVIKLWTQFYVPGYGMCTALDVGGAIKGNDIDMAYEDASKAAWGAGCRGCRSARQFEVQIRGSLGTFRHLFRRGSKQSDGIEPWARIFLPVGPHQVGCNRCLV